MVLMAVTGAVCWKTVCASLVAKYRVPVVPGALGSASIKYVPDAVVTAVTQVWMLGSPALGICYVAAGRLNAYFCLDLQLWDVAAAAVILKEAGGTLTDITGGPWIFSEGGQVASNGVLHGGMLRGIKPALDIYLTRRKES